MSLAALGLLTLPGRPHDEDTLRQAVVRAWRSYEGTRYVWGGENRLGIDCSGLVRRGLIDATWREGLRTLNPRLVRASVSLSWHDYSARALAANPPGICVYRGHGPSVRQPGEWGRYLRPGDFAVTQSGIHALGYLGNNEWIQAEPGAGRVIVEPATATDAWLDQPVTFHRWSLVYTHSMDTPI